MSRRRRYSSPSRARPLGNKSCENDPAKVLAPVSSGSAATPTPPITLQEPAQALASMTTELELREVRSRIERLDRDFHAFQIRIEHDKTLREENGQLLNNLLKEMESMKVLIGGLQGGLKGLEDGLKRQEDEIMEFKRNVQEELKDIKQGEKRLQSCLEKRYSSAWLRTEADALRRVHISVLEEPGGSKDHTIAGIKIRIRECINSTRRWNREHKTSHLPDSQFIANYLRKQSQRDPAMAVHLQRSLQRRIRERDTLTGGTWSQPQNLEELCQSASWKDVKDMVKDVLIDNEQRTTSLLNGVMVD